MQNKRHTQTIHAQHEFWTTCCFDDFAWPLLYLTAFLFGNAYLEVFSLLFVKRVRFRNKRIR